MAADSVILLAMTTIRVYCPEIGILIKMLLITTGGCLLKRLLGTSQSVLPIGCTGGIFCISKPVSEDQLHKASINRFGSE
jgi:hypothetical protein